MKQNRFSPVEANINLVPYLDVLLVLVVILMTSVSSFYEHTEVLLPQSIGKEQLAQAIGRTHPLIITVSQHGDLSLKNSYLDEKNLAEQKFFIKLKALYQKDPQSKVILQADKRCSYEQVMRVMSLLNQAGFEKIGLVTDKER